MNSRRSELRSSAPSRVPTRGRFPLSPRALVAALGMVAAPYAMATPAAAQSFRVAALPASDVFSLRVVGDTIAAGMDTVTFVSTDGGASWHTSTRPSKDAKVIDAVLVRNHRLFAGTFGTGVFVSDDLGA